MASRVRCDWAGMRITIECPATMPTKGLALPREDVRESTARRFYQPELDCLRFFAFFCVFVFHTFPPEADYYAARHIPLGWLVASISRAGSFGVDLFFLLSAYLITELLLREKDDFARIHLKSFYVRRILRIWPLYFLGILIGTLLPLVDPEQHFPLKYVAAFLLLSGNWMTSLVGFPGSVMNPLWSVSFEEQFYLLWPTVVSKVKGVRALLFASGILLIAAQCGRLLLLKYGRHSEVAVFTNTIARLDPLALGVLTAVLMRQRRPQLTASWRLACLLLGAIVWLAAGHYFAMSRAFMVIGYPAMAVGAWLIFMAIFDLGVAPRFLRYLGKISYGLYVFHMLCLYLTEKMIGGYAKNMTKFIVFWWLGLAVTIAVAAVSYAFFESPFLRLKERFAYVRSRPV
jgi:peptidoglycan/LPS O-acetylase OafA/YrhL